MKVSVLVSTYNGVQDLHLFLHSLKNVKMVDSELEFIFRDDNSSDLTCNFIEDNFPEALLLKGKENLGFVKSNNIAFKHAKGDVICCLNQDTVLEENFFQEALTTLDDNPECVAISPNMLMPWVMTLEDFKNRQLLDMPSFEYQISQFGYIQYVEVSNKERLTNFLTGGAFFLRRSMLPANEDLFDEHIDAYCEDTELSLRIRERGGKMFFCPKAVVYHNQVAKNVYSLKGLKKLLKISWNRFSLFTRKLPPKDFIRRFPFFVFGIIKKVDHLGLSTAAKNIAYPVSACVAVVFTLLLPYWLLKSVYYH